MRASVGVLLSIVCVHATKRSHDGRLANEWIDPGEISAAKHFLYLTIHYRYED
jgi:hypothetical protein